MCSRHKPIFCLDYRERLTIVKTVYVSSDIGGNFNLLKYLKYFQDVERR